MNQPIIDWVIDADTHVTEPPDLFTSRLPAKYKDQAPHVVKQEGTGLETWVVGESGSIAPLGHTAVAGWKDPFPAAPSGFAEVPLASHDPNARLAYMDELAIWAMAIYPNVGGFGSQSFLGLKDPELMLSCVRAYNDFLTEWCGTDSRRLIPITALPFWDLKATVAEIERCAAAGHKGILFSGEPHSHGMPVLANPHWDPLWACAQALDLPVSFHIGAGDFQGQAFWTPERLTHYGPGGVKRHVHDGTLPGQRQADRRPALFRRAASLSQPQVRLCRERIGFIPFLLEACDHTFNYGQVRKQRPEFEMLPSEYSARQVYGCYFFEEYAPAELLGRIPPDNVLFETDYPHPVVCMGTCAKRSTPVSVPPRRTSVARCSSTMRRGSTRSMNPIARRPWGLPKALRPTPAIWSKPFMMASKR